MMIFVNTVYKENVISEELYKNFIIILSPYAPHICEELWKFLGEEESISYAKIS